MLIIINFKMGTWHLEAFKMALYIFMPVVAFYGYHQVGFMEENLVKHQRRFTTLESVKTKKMVDEARKIAREVEEEELSRRLKEHEAKDAEA